MDTQADVLIVTVTKVESQAVMAAFAEATEKKPQPQRIGDRVYHDLGEINDTRVFMALSEMGAGGLGASQQTVQKGIEALKPSAVIMVGIAFGVNEQKQANGDILVARQLMLYEPQRVGQGQSLLRGDHDERPLLDAEFMRFQDAKPGAGRHSTTEGAGLRWCHLHAFPTALAFVTDDPLFAVTIRIARTLTHAGIS